MEGEPLDGFCGSDLECGVRRKQTNDLLTAEVSAGRFSAYDEVL